MEITNIKPLYRYKNANDSISVTPIRRNENDEIYGYRLIADEGNELYHSGENQHMTVLDVKKVDNWTQEPIEDVEPIEDTEPSIGVTEESIN